MRRVYENVKKLLSPMGAADIQRSSGFLFCVIVIKMGYKILNRFSPRSNWLESE